MSNDDDIENPVDLLILLRVEHPQADFEELAMLLYNKLGKGELNRPLLAILMWFADAVIGKAAIDRVRERKQ
jgi:hypothetical protein